MSDIEIVNIYPGLNPKENQLDRGTVNIKLKDLGINIRNIYYAINEDRSVYVNLPSVPYKKVEKEDGSFHMVRSISVSFEDKEFQKELLQFVREKVLENFELNEAKTIEP